MRIRIEIPGDPVPQGRGKVGRWQAKDGRSGVTVRDPARSRTWKGIAKSLMIDAIERRGLSMPVIPAGEPVKLVVFAYFACPRSDYRKRTPLPERRHTKRGDLDNIVKCIKDAANGVLWLDDAQVSDLYAYKRIAAQGEGPRVVVTVEDGLSDAE